MAPPRYWTFERECINRALLDMITASLCQAAAAGRELYVHPKPRTMSDARANLRAFSDEAATRPQPEGFVPVDLDPKAVECFGWTELKGSVINAQFKRARVPQDPKVDDETYPAIVYRFVTEEGVPEIETILSQIQFFYLTGFMTVSFNENNWLGKGVLVDFSDIVPYHTGRMWWQQAYYAHQGPGFCRSSVERAAQKGLLGPQPRFIHEPFRHRLTQYQRQRDVRIVRPPAPPPTWRRPPQDNRIQEEFAALFRERAAATKLPNDVDEAEQTPK